MSRESSENVENDADENDEIADAESAAEHSSVPDDHESAVAAT